jgi:hypothetical protein
MEVDDETTVRLSPHAVARASPRRSLGRWLGLAGGAAAFAESSCSISAFISCLNAISTAFKSSAPLCCCLASFNHAACCISPLVRSFSFRPAGVVPGRRPLVSFAACFGSGGHACAPCLYDVDGSNGLSPPIALIL